MKPFLALLAAIAISASPLQAYGPEKPSWFAVNDTVMGGISSGEAVRMEDALIRFAGILSLENRGGFSSIRSESKAYAFEKGKDILLTVKGDGRQYYFDLRTSPRQRAFTYRQPFRTEAGTVTKIRLPLAGFSPSYFGRRVPMADPLDPRQVRSIGITLSDKNPGPFRLDILDIELVDPKEPEAMTVEGLLKQAIHYGVPLYNRGDEDACAAVYETALFALTLLPKDSLTDQQRKILESTLQAGKAAGNDDDRAWVLRRGMDKLLNMKMALPDR